MSDREPTGDAMISGFDTKMWSIVYEVFWKFHVPITFRNVLFMPELKVPHEVQFFVPFQTEKYEEIEKFINYELEKDNSESFDFKGDYIPGRKVLVYPFSGIHPYMTRQRTELMVKGMTDMFMKRIKYDLGDVPWYYKLKWIFWYRPLSFLKRVVESCLD